MASTRHLGFLLAAVLLAASAPRALRADMISLNGDSPGSGSNLDQGTRTLQVPAGTISFPQGDVDDGWDHFNTGFIAAGFSGNVFRGSPARMEFTFDVYRVSFAYGVNSTYFLMDFLDESQSVITTFNSSPAESGTKNMMVSDVRGIRWRGQYGSGMIDNVTLYSGRIPEPSTLAMAALALAVLGAYTWQRRKWAA